MMAPDFESLVKLAGNLAGYFKALDNKGRDFPSGGVPNDRYTVVVLLDQLRQRLAANSPPPTEIIANWLEKLGEGAKWPSVLVPIFRSSGLRLLARYPDPEKLGSVLLELAEKWNLPLPQNLGSACQWPQESLTGDNYLKKLCDLKQVVETQRIGRYRMLFPGYGSKIDHSEKIGALVEVEITALPRSMVEEIFGDSLKKEISILAAPWTFYLPIDDGQESFRDLQLALVPALTSAGIADLEDKVFLVDLRPLDLEDIDGAKVPDRLHAAWALSSPVLKISGPSLGMACALAAWASTQQLSIRRVIASGGIDKIGGICEIGGVDEKLAVAKDFRKIACHLSWPFLLPKKNSGAKGDDLYFYPSLKDVFQKSELLKLFTDGFDSLRDGLARFTPSDSVTCFPEEPPETGYCQSDLNEAAQLGEDLAPVLNTKIIQDCNVVRFCHLIAPFNEKPTILTAQLVHKLWLRCTLEHQHGEYADRPVVLAIRLKALSQLSTASDLSTLLADSLQNWFHAQNATPPDVTADAIHIALRRTGKLVLLVEDSPSLELVAVSDDQFKLRQKFWYLLRSLTESKPNNFAQQAGIAPQYVVAICSDEHHYHFWLKADDANHSAEVSASTGSR